MNKMTTEQIGVPIEVHIIAAQSKILIQAQDDDDYRICEIEGLVGLKPWITNPAPEYETQEQTVKAIMREGNRRTKRPDYMVPATEQGNLAHT